jgi:alpha-D-ribose 1-methylphosphonate 5-triphosphate synthase subunit PhnH
MQADTHLAAGFSRPVFQSQAAFRAVLAALAEPGTVQAVATDTPAPEGLSLAAATALLTLADYETPIYLPPALRDGPAGAWLRFHCGATLVAEPGGAMFAVLDGADEGPRLAAFSPGLDQFPDRSATLFVQCASLAGGQAVTLSGPGIALRRTISPSGLRNDFWAEVAANAELYPLGVDLVLCAGEQLIGLPRSTRIEATR